MTVPKMFLFSSVDLCLEVDEVPAAQPAAVVESDTDRKENRTGARESNRDVQGQTFSVFLIFLLEL